MKDGKPYSVELESGKVEFLEQVVRTYDLPDVGKPIRCLINYAGKFFKSNPLVRMQQCNQTDNQAHSRQRQDCPLNSEFERHADLQRQRVRAGGELIENHPITLSTNFQVSRLSSS